MSRDSMNANLFFELDERGVYCGQPTWGSSLRIVGSKPVLNSFGSMEILTGDLILIDVKFLSSFGNLKKITGSFFVFGEVKLPPINFSFERLVTRHNEGGRNYCDYLQERQAVERASLTDLPLLLNTVCCLVKPLVVRKMKECISL